MSVVHASRGGGDSRATIAIHETVRQCAAIRRGGALQSAIRIRTPVRYPVDIALRSRGHAFGHVCRAITVDEATGGAGGPAETHDADGRLVRHAAGGWVAVVRSAGDRIHVVVWQRLHARAGAVADGRTAAAAAIPPAAAAGTVVCAGKRGPSVAAGLALRRRGYWVLTRLDGELHGGITVDGD